MAPLRGSQGIVPRRVYQPRSPNPLGKIQNLLGHTRQFNSDGALGYKLKAESYKLKAESYKLKAES